MTAAYYPYRNNPIKSWNELMAAENEFGDYKWAFRGQDTLAFPATSLERHCKALGLTGDAISDLEIKLIRDFARRYHLYGGSAPPKKGHTLEWLALMQHYGAPTRLLDFTYSFLFAAYFALETSDACSVIWALNETRLTDAAKKLISDENLVSRYQKVRDGAPFRDLYMNRPPRKFVDSANPIRLNERLTIQQGLFLAPGDVTATFEDNLRVLPDHVNMLIQIIIDHSCRFEVLSKLHQFGINRATLFPGLEGFAHSLRTKSLILAKLPPRDILMLEPV
jgi:hypothetical protein